MGPALERQLQPRQQASSSIKPNPAAPAANLQAHPILSLQRTIGNQAVQQLLQRQPAAAPAPPAAAPRRTWKDIQSDLLFAGISHPARVPALVEELVQAAEAPGYDRDILNDGVRMVAQLARDGHVAAADRLLAAIRIRYLMANAGGREIPSGGGPAGDPGELIAMAGEAARAGDHERAFALFGAAHEILSYMALVATEEAKATIDSMTRSPRYTQIAGIYGDMRAIYRFYFVLEAEALAAGDAGRAAEARDRAARLHEELRTQDAGFEESAAEIGETSQVTTRAGRPAFRFHGANEASTDLSELPGHPFAEDLLATGEGQATEDLGLVQGALRAQAELQGEIAREPEIRKAFGTEPVDLNDTAKRQKVWRILYGVYKRRGDGALGALMDVMGRYLKAHTYHTGFNVRDFGASYLDSKMPADLADRLVHDCGVYALTVAWDVFQTVKAGDPKLKVSFKLATLLDHIILIVTDEAAGERYLVNNDQITKIGGPAGTRIPGLSLILDFFGDPAPNLDEEVAKQYSLFRDLPYLVTPMNYMELGSTAGAAGAFKSALWERYGAATRYMSKVPVDFSMLQDFSEDAAQLDLLLDDLAPSANDAEAISRWLAAGWPHILSLLLLFEQIGMKSFQSITPPASPPAGSSNASAIRWPGSNHPLLRVALVLLRLRSLGQELTAGQQQYLTFFETAYPELMNRSRQAAEAGSF